VPGRAYARLVFAGAGFAALLAALWPSPAHSAPAGTLAMNPSNNALDVSDTVAITFDVSGGVDIHRVAIAVTYNASVVQAVDADLAAAGTQILPGAFPGTDTEGAVTQNTVSGGIINYQYELDGSAEVSGSGTIATVQFLALANGNANLAWSVRTFADANDVTLTPGASAAVIAVGAVPSATPPPTDTPLPTDTPDTTSTPTAAASSTAAASATATRTATQTATPAGSATATNTPSPSSTPRITVITPVGNPPAAQNGVVNNTDPSQASRAQGLPTAGNEGPPIQWWRWTFFAAALMLGFAGWFFTFAVHYGDRDVVLMDPFDAARRKRGRRLPRR
jgi:hypothetical protein